MALLCGKIAVVPESAESELFGIVREMVLLTHLRFASVPELVSGGFAISEAVGFTPQFLVAWLIDSVLPQGEYKKNVISLGLFLRRSKPS